MTTILLLQRPWIQGSLPYIGMTSAVVSLAVNQILSKMAISSGTSIYILSVYANGIATLILIPCAFLPHSHRSKRPPLSFPVLWRLFLLASIGCSGEISLHAGMNYSSPTLSTALMNLIPAFTFILALVFRMEQVNFTKFPTLAKFLGTIISISGAFIVTLYNGPPLLNSTLLPPPHLHVLSPPQNWVLAGILLACAALAFASCSIFQASIQGMYPVEIMVVAFYCLFVTIQSSVVTLIAERDLNAWRLETKIGFIAVSFSAIINVAYRQYVTAWCISRRGPLFVSLFKPLMVVVAVVIGVIFMTQVLYFGSLVGALVLIVGFYGVIWGKSKDVKKCKETESSNNLEAPLLHDNFD
ncbi:hypothetical protein ACS0TY_010068 [Phlomoides rotata]